jgi:hypothetical protein
MHHSIRALLFVLLMASLALAGDDASGSVPYRLDLSQPFTVSSMTAADRTWGVNLANKFNYKGRVAHFVRTSLPLQIRERKV